MKTVFVCLKKEITEHVRSGRLTILGIIFLLFGILSPAVAKLTPWLLTTMADSLAESGMTVTAAEPTALDSWAQFFKNIPMALIAFVLVESAIFTKEYQSGTLILSLTKGLNRYKVVLSKTLMLILLWTVCYFMCFGITFGYSAYYWDNSAAQNLIFAAGIWWLFGIWVIALMALFSVMASSNAAVLGGVGSVVFLMMLISAAPKTAKYLPTHLMDGNLLVLGKTVPGDYTAALIICIAECVLFFALAVPVFNKKRL